MCPSHGESLNIHSGAKVVDLIAGTPASSGKVLSPNAWYFIIEQIKRISFGAIGPRSGAC